MSRVAIVPCRAGSKGIPHKNTRLFAGEPLFMWAVKVGLETCDRVIVTTDIPGLDRVINVGKPVVEVAHRPPHLASDTAPMLGVVRHVVSLLPPGTDTIVLLQPTAPLRTASMVRAACAILDKSQADSVVSVVESQSHSPDFACAIDESGALSAWGQPSMLFPATRQSCRKAYFRDGSVYVTRRHIIEHGEGSLYGSLCMPLVIPASQSANIDTEEDWARAESIMQFRIQVQGLMKSTGTTSAKQATRKPARGADV